MSSALSKSIFSWNTLFFLFRHYKAVLRVRGGSYPRPLLLKRQFHELTAEARMWSCSWSTLSIDFHLLWSNIFLFCMSQRVMSSLLGIYRSQLGEASVCLDESLGIFLTGFFPLKKLEKSLISSSSSYARFYFLFSSLPPYII